MGYRYKKSFSKSEKREFAKKMEEIDEYCAEHGISHSLSSDSYYFEVNGQSYRVSNHTIEASNRAAYDDLGNQIREKYHDDKRDPEVIYITASKTRLIEIHQAILAGKTLNKRGYVV